MEDLISSIITPPANFLMWLLFSREGAEIMPSLLLFASVLSILGVLYSLRSNKN
jgi:hypothetical protein